MNSYVYAYRGGLIENRHKVSVAIVKPNGDLVAYAGNPQLPAFMRSSAKPFQAQALYLSGAVEKFGLSEQEIAISCASHSGSPKHLEVVGRYLEKIGLGPEYLACGAHLPFDKTSATALLRSGLAPNVLHSNCSGKHTGMLAAALALGANPRGYEKPEHPVQQINLKTLGDLSGQTAIPFGIDGCNVPSFVLPLALAAKMFAQLAQPSAAPEPYQMGLAGAAKAMRAHPDMVAGDDELDTELMQKLPNLVVKGGAEGYYAMALQDSRWGPLGIAFKVEDGSSVAREPFVVALLEHLNVLSPDTPIAWRTPAIHNVRGLDVGVLEPKVELAWS